MRIGLISTATLAALLGSTALVRADGEACSQVSSASLAIAGVEITGSKAQDAANGLPKHCIVTGIANQRTGADGKSYAIQFELRLPAEWNGRFLHQVNGGNDGVVVPALGDKPDGFSSGGTVPLARGFAVLSSDSGHSGSVTPIRTYQSAGTYCREYQQTVIIGGKQEQSYGTACRQPDGSWKVVS